MGFRLSDLTSFYPPFLNVLVYDSNSTINIVKILCVLIVMDNKMPGKEAHTLEKIMLLISFFQPSKNYLGGTKLILYPSAFRHFEWEHILPLDIDLLEIHISVGGYYF